MFGDELVNLLHSFGTPGLLLSLFLLFFIDSMLFPSLPELFLLIFFLAHPSFVWGIELYLIALSASFCGNTFLYLFVERAGMPEFISNIMKKYTKILISSTEKMLFVNNFIPVLPYTGAFISVNKWKYKKAISYLIAGAAIKYGLLILLADTFYMFFSSGMAQKATLALVAITITISLIVSYFRKREIEG